DEANVENLLQNEGIIRNKQKIRSAVNNARAFLNVQDDFGSFHAFLWQFAGQTKIITQRITHPEIQLTNSLSTALAKDLQRRGFSFVGPVICYAYLQAIGIIQDHTAECFLYKRK